MTFDLILILHVAIHLGIRREDIPKEIVQREEGIYRAQAAETGKPEKVLDKIVQGKMEKFYRETCFLEQQYIRDPEITIQDLIHDMITKTGENITVRRFVRYKLGGE